VALSANYIGQLERGKIRWLLEHTEPTPIPTRVGATEIKQVHTAA
jgi:hypothetical protein